MHHLFRTALLAAGLALTTISGALAQERGNAVIVTGEASISVVPDLALLRVGVTTDGKTAREASEANNRATAPVIAALKEAGIAEKDIQTAQLSIQPVHESARGGATRLTGFRASNQVGVIVRDLSQVPDVVDRAVAAGANELSGISFSVAEPSRALDQVRGEALADARRKGEIYAKAAGGNLGRVIAIDEERSGHGPLSTMRLEAATPVAAGETTLRLSVTASFELLY